MHALLAVMLIALAGIVPAVAHAQVHVDIDIGFRLPAPPRLVVVPPVPEVQWVPAPGTPGNVFFYGGQYWVFTPRGWHVSRRHDGPWVIMAPQFVPRPVLLVPVEYYHVPPGHWKKWDKKRAPHWTDEWGREWADKRGWKSADGPHASDHHDKPGKPPKGNHKPDKDDDKPGKGKGKGKGQDR